MTKRVQILGHDAETANTFVGDDREITVDTDNRELRIHDGVTPGGQRVYNRDENDERYQRRSVELDGLLGWEPNQRGFPARLGSQTYRLRSITVNGAELTIVNGNGHDGDPLLGIAEVVSTDHTWSGHNTYTQAILADGGVVGNLLGNVVGDVTGDVTGNLVGGVAGTFNGAGSGSWTGNVDARGHTLLLDAGQILQAMLSAGVIDFIVKAGLPVGSIVAFAGSLVDIPDNWYVCDGTNGTPNLIDRFIVGAGPDFPVNTAGGVEIHSHVITIDSGGAHAHTGNADGHVLTTNELPTHAHNTPTDQYGSSGAANPGHVLRDDNSGSPSGRLSDTVGSDDPHVHTLTIASGGAHLHTASSADESNVPPYFALLYIMKGA